MLNILEKYKPNNSIGFIGHFKFVNDFKNRMKDNNFNKLLLCIGESGIGKTDLLKTIFKELHFDYVEFYNSESFKTEIDAKTRLQEYSLKEFKVLPIYKLLESKGPNHKPTFKIQVKIKNSKPEFGIGSSKKIAQQNAANKLIKKLANL